MYPNFISFACRMLTAFPMDYVAVSVCRGHEPLYPLANCQLTACLVKLSCLVCISGSPHLKIHHYETYHPP